MTNVIDMESRKPVVQASEAPSDFAKTIREAEAMLAEYEATK